MIRSLALVGLGGCAAVADAPGIVVSEQVRTVATATWTGGEERSRVEISDADGAFVLTGWVAAGGGAKVAIPGLHADTEYTAVIESESGARSESTSFSTGSLANGIPSWSVEGKPGWQGYMAIGAMVEDAAALVLDESGGVVWYAIEPGTHVIRMHPRRDGTGMLYNLFRTEDGAPPTPFLVSVDWDGTEAYRAEILGMTHDFVELADGTIAYLQLDPGINDGMSRAAIGNAIVERAPDGSEKTVWSTWDTWDPRVDGDVTDDGEWTHANSIEIDAEEALYTVSLYGMDSIVEIDRASGEVVRQIGGPTTDYVIDDEAVFTDQHQMQWIGDDELLLFDNGTATTNSRALGLRLDDAANSASMSWSWQPAEPLWSPILGDVDRDDDGSTLITWSSSGVITDVGPDDEQRSELSLEFGWFFGFNSRVHQLGGVERLR